MHALSRLAMFMAVAFLPALAQAQVAVEQPSQPVGPTMSAAISGIRVQPETEQISAQEAADRAAHGGLGTGGALMIVGGAAFIAGLIIGGGVGTALAVGGVLVAAYGLYVFLK
jgi:hypothetical protein